MKHLHTVAYLCIPPFGTYNNHILQKHPLFLRWSHGPWRFFFFRSRQSTFLAMTIKDAIDGEVVSLQHAPGILVGTLLSHGVFFGGFNRGGRLSKNWGTGIPLPWRLPLDAKISTFHEACVKTILLKVLQVHCEAPDHQHSQQRSLKSPFQKLGNKWSDVRSPQFEDPYRPTREDLSRSNWPQNPIVK